MAKAGRGSDQFPLRLPPGMRDAIKRAAEDSGRSMNSEILEVLREYYPEEPSLGELVAEIDHALALLRDIQQTSASGDVTRSNKFLTVMGRLNELNEHLWEEASSDGRSSPIVRLDPDVMSDLESLQREWNLPSSSLVESLVNDLIRMSIRRIFSGEENLKVWIGEGDAQRMLEIQKPVLDDEEEKKA